MKAIPLLLLLCIMAPAVIAQEDALRTAPDLPAGLVADLSDEDLAAAAEAIGRSVRDEGSRALLQRMHTGAFLHRLGHGRDFDEELVRELRIHWSYDELMEDILWAIDGRGAFDFRELVWHEGQRRARFRVIGEDLSLNYIDLLLVRDQWGEYRIADYAPMSAGVDASVFVGEMMAALFTLENLVGEIEEFEDAVAAIHLLEDPAHRFMVAFHTLEPALTWEHFPAALEARPADALLLFGMMLKMVTQLDEDVAASVMAMALEAFPDHPTIHLNLVDLHAAAGDFEGAMHTLDDLERHVGADGMLEALRGMARIELGDLEAGRALVAEATRTDGHVEILVVFDLGMSIIEEDFARTVAIFERLETHFGYDIQPESLAENPQLATLITSEPYRDWLARRVAAEEPVTDE